MVPDSTPRLRTALQSVLAGPTAEERQRGYHSFFSSRTADALLEVRSNPAGDTVWVNFRNFVGSLPDDQGVRSFLPPGTMASLTWTLFKSFPALDAVHFAFDGSEEEFWRWLDSEPRVFTREDWEQV